MQVGLFWVITELEGPWQVGERTGPTSDNFWYIVNKDTGESKKIGPVRLRGTNYFDRAEAEAVRRNKHIKKAKVA
jgi:hypothetical protein